MLYNKEKEKKRKERNNDYYENQIINIKIYKTKKFINTAT